METVLIEVTNKKAYKLLEDLESLHVLKVLKKETKNTQKISQKYRGVFSAQDAKSFNEHTQHMRKEWSNI